MSDEQENQAAPQPEPAAAPSTPMSTADLEQQFKALRGRMALLTGLVVADTAMLIVMLILAR